MLDLINFYLIPGLVVGAIYTLGAIGISLIFSILRVAHLAHGDLMAIGAYFALSWVHLLGGPAYLALPAAMALTALVAIGVDRTCYRPLRRRRTVMVIIASFGVALMLRAALMLIWGPDTQVYQSGIQRPMVVAGLRLQEKHLFILGAAIVLVVLLHLFLTRTITGKAMRAVSDDPDLARVCGVRTERVILAMWITAGSLCAAAGVFLGVDTQLSPLMGFNMLLPMFAAAILGGIGKPYGAIVGGMVIGLAEELSTYPLFGEPLIEPTYKSAIAFTIMVLMLLWRPTGLFRGKVL
ncbi:MAG: branched-chain amino acid ABC transporter permease [Alphaproteobacteria bacterium]|nr:branched-chain amino acid ABC transporter permease [Alphaproteobacteria bacterium]